MLPDLIILDLMLPVLSGDHVLKAVKIIHQYSCHCCVCQNDGTIKIDLLRMGADDYMTKPFNLYELLARIEANLKRSAPVSQKEDIHLRYKDIEIENCTVYIKRSYGAVYVNRISNFNTSITVSAKEFFQSRIFMNRSGRKNIPMTMIQLTRILATFVKK